MKHKISLFSIFFLIVLAFIFPSIVQAGSGCCGVVLPHTSSPQYQTTTSEQCATLNAGYAGSNYIFEEGKVAAKDAKTCTDGQVVAEEAKSTKPIAPQLQVSIPGFGKFSDVTCDNPDVICEFPWIGEYIKAIYDYGIGVVGILSVIVMMIGGIIRLTAAGNHAQISQGNTYIKSSILGVVFTLCSYMILFIVNPNLTILRPIKSGYIEVIDLETVDTIYDNSPQVLIDNAKYPDIVNGYQAPKSVTNKGSCKANPCDNCVVTGIPTKNNNFVNKDLNNKLMKVKSSVTWRITEAYPCTSKHKSNCHYNGRCVDIGLTSPKTCENFVQLRDDLRAAGLTVLNESKCGDDNVNTTFSTGAHLHVSE